MKNLILLYKDGKGVLEIIIEQKIETERGEV